MRECVLERVPLSLDGQKEIPQQECNPVFSKEKFISSTLVVCPSCGKVIPARKVERDGYIYLVKECFFENQIFESLLEKANKYWKEKKYNLKHRMKYDVKIGQDKFGHDNIINSNKTSGVFFLVTQRCNADCPICYDKKWLKRPDMDIQFVKKTLRNFKYRHVFLSGGEPTIREDLPELIAMIKKSGNIPGIVTNGLKLADANYLKKLIRSGLDNIYFSFDGFSPDIYKSLRNDAGQYEQKLKALENLKNLKDKNVRTTILSTIVKGTNEDQIPYLVNYCCHNDFIWMLSLRFLNLCDANGAINFDNNNLISREEMIFSVCRTLGLPLDYFNLFYEMRFSFVELLSSLFPNTNMYEPGNGKIYLERKKTVSLIFTETELKELLEVFKNKNFNKILKAKYLWWITLSIKNKFQPVFIEKEMHKRNMFSIVVGEPPLMLSDYPLIGDRIPNIIYFPNANCPFAANSI